MEGMRSGSLATRSRAGAGTGCLAWPNAPEVETNVVRAQVSDRGGSGHTGDAEHCFLRAKGASGRFARTHVVVVALTVEAECVRGEIFEP